MIDPIPEPVRKLWDEWNIRGMMLFSLAMQAFLIVCSPFRKSKTSKLLTILLWSVYLVADWAAVTAVGLIADRQNKFKKPSTPCPELSENSDLLALWPPFLLLHLGGPDTITAFALEDNELWIRHLLALIVQGVASIYVFLLSLPETRLAAPTIMMLLAGTVKYLERTRAFYLSSVDRIRDSLGKEYDDHFEHNVRDRFGYKKSVWTSDNKIKIENHLEAVEEAYHFNIFKLIVNLKQSYTHRSKSDMFFRQLSPEDALRIMEVELNFVYEVFYTKIQVIHSIMGFIMRFTSFVLVVTSFAVFNFHVKNQFYEDLDVKITYILFSGAVGLDALAFFMLLIFSDWTFIALKISENESKLKNRIKSIVTCLLSRFLNCKNPRWHEFQKHPDGPTHEVLATPPCFRRWFGHLSRHSLISYCIKVLPIRIYRANNCEQRALGKIIHYLGIGEFIKAVENTMFMVNQYTCWIRSTAIHFLGSIPLLGPILKKVVAYLGIDSIGFIDQIKYVSHEPLPKKLWEFIFCQLKEESKVTAVINSPDTNNSFFSARFHLDLKEDSDIYRNIILKFNQRTYHRSLLLWHVATDLLYFTEDDEVISGEKDIPHCNFSKLLSDYMLYLMVMQPTIVYANTGNWKITFQNTCKETNEIFREMYLEIESPGISEKAICARTLFNAPITEFVRSMETLGMQAVLRQMEEENNSESVLVEASILANELLLRLEQEKRWEILSKIWVDLLVYAACNCDARTHAQQVGKGGELVTFVWLLMIHFGVGDVSQFPNLSFHKISEGGY